MAEKVEFELVAKTSGAVAGVNKVDEAVKKTSRATKKASKELSGMQQAGGAVLGKLDQLTGGLASKFVAVGSAAKLSGKAMKTALISSGIGLAVVAIGLIVEHWDAISEALGFVNKDLERQVELNAENLKLTTEQLSEIDLRIKLERKQGGNADDLIKKRKELIKLQKAQILLSIADLKTQELDLTNEAKKVGFWERFSNDFMIRTKGMNKVTRDMMGKITDEEDKLIKGKASKIRKLEMLLLNIQISETPDAVKDTSEKDEEEAEKEKAAAIERIRKSLIDTEAEERIEKKRLIKEDFEEQIKLAEEYFGKESEKVKELRAAQKVAEDAQNKVFSDQDDAIQKAKDKKEDEKIEREQERIAKTLQSENAISIAKKRFAAEEIQDEVLRLEKLKEIDLLEAEQEAARLQVIVDNAKAGSDAKMDAEIALNEFLEDARQGNLKNVKKVSDASVKITDLESEAKRKSLEGYAGAISSLSSTLGQETAAGKGLAVASSLINTYAAITGALKAAQASPGAAVPGYAIAQAIATGVAGLAAVKKIMSVEVPGGGGGGSTQSASMPTAPQPPAFNIVGSSGESQLADAIGSQTQRPARAYVVSNDVTTAQELDRNIIEGASIG